MALSIQNPKAEKLARELASKSGETLTQAIITALEDRLERMRGKRTPIDLTDELLNIADRCSKLPDLDTRTPDQILGYNNQGVPK
jgi:antitoxin VapB